MTDLNVDPAALERAGRSCQDIRDAVHGVAGMVEPEMQAAAAGLPGFSTGGWKSGASLQMALDGFEEEARSLTGFLDRLTSALETSAAQYRQTEELNSVEFSRMIGGR
ncbi:type VII secretion target [Catenuloplanes atrovinosus]|uniref:ESAT-6-like protein n=1 Tax=Catenuloplanes atrovinosus TaxID=137266 RepID=A0AAE3YNJ7_9ACTN|nr:type VII secretion target [Catenuloplanes atrovinosus]MDR7275671.1 hypothetical protein [Catenuloplanes atrovinosus]